MIYFTPGFTSGWVCLENHALNKIDSMHMNITELPLGKSPALECGYGGKDGNLCRASDKMIGQEGMGNKEKQQRRENERNEGSRDGLV